MNGDDSLSFEVFREQWLTDLREGDPSTTALGHRFAHKLIRQWRDIEDSSSDLVYCDGAADGGIDIAYLEPAYKNSFLFDLNGYLKWEKLGKSEADSPRLRALLAVTKMFMGQRMGGHPSPRATIVAAIS